MINLISFTFRAFQLLCINSEFKKQKPCSFSRALRITTQKALYLLVGVASAIRGFYFQAGVNDQLKWASYLRSAYYPLMLSGSSLLVCFWAEVCAKLLHALLLHLNKLIKFSIEFLDVSFTRRQH